MDDTIAPDVDKHDHPGDHRKKRLLHMLTGNAGGMNLKT